MGKSTLMNTLFKSKVSRRSVLPAAQEKIPKTVEIKSISHGEEAFCVCFHVLRVEWGAVPNKVSLGINKGF